MNSTELIKGIGDFILWTTELLFENVGNLFNNAAIVLGFIGLFFWLNMQRKFNAQAKNNPNQRK